MDGRFDHCKWTPSFSGWGQKWDPKDVWVPKRDAFLHHTHQTRVHPEAFYLKPTKLLQSLKTKNSTFLSFIILCTTEGVRDQKQRDLQLSVCWDEAWMYSCLVGWRDWRVQSLSCKFALIWWQFCVFLLVSSVFSATPVKTALSLNSEMVSLLTLNAKLKF